MAGQGEVVATLRRPPPVTAASAARAGQATRPWTRPSEQPQRFGLLLLGLSLGGCGLGRPLLTPGQAPGPPAPRRRSVETQTRPSKKRSTIMPSRPAAALAPRSADVEALPQAPESLPHVLARVAPRPNEGHPQYNNRLQRDGSLSLSLSPFLSLTVFVVGPVSLGPRRQASGASKAERRDADEAVKEAIDDHAEPTGCCPGPAVRRRGSPPPGPGIPAPCPGRVAPRPNEGHPQYNNRLQRDGSLSLSLSHLFSLSQSLWLVP